MHSLTTLRRTYSAVSSSLPSSDDIPSSDQKRTLKPSQPRSHKLNQRAIPRHSFLIRLIIFVLLEFSFIALVSATLRKPIIPHLSFTINETKGAVTALAILWHALAIYAVKDILLNIFSAEWIRQHGGSHSLTFQEVDRVSRLTTGFVDQAKHFASERATPSFRLGFLSLLLSILLNGLGPSAIGVNLASYVYPSNIQVANITVGGPDVTGGYYLDAARRASSITQLEILDNFTTSGYHARQPNTLIPWPSSDSMSENTTMTYESDVIRYNFSCSWNKPSRMEPTSMSLMVANSSKWTVYPISFTDPESVSVWEPIVSPLQEVEYYDNRSIGFEEIGFSSLTSFLFFGGNASFVGRYSTTSGYLNLQDTPSSIIPCNTSLNPDFAMGQELDCNPFLASVLVCDPQLEVLPAMVNATMSSLDATILSGPPTVKNIPIVAANTIFSTSLLEITSQVTLSTGPPVLAIFYRLFVSAVNPTQMKLLSLERINQNMNDFFATSAKAYLDGFRSSTDLNGLPQSSFSTVNTSAIMQVQKMALVGSEPFLIALSVIVGLLVIQLGVLVAITKVEELEGFEVENIVKRFAGNL